MSPWGTDGCGCFGWVRQDGTAGGRTGGTVGGAGIHGAGRCDVRFGVEPDPNGDVMVHAIANFELPDGRRIEGDGVIPDEHVDQTRAGLLAGRDRPLDAALEWIRAAGSEPTAQN